MTDIALTMNNITNLEQLNNISGNKVIEAYLSTLTSKNTVRQYRSSIELFFNTVYGEQPVTLRMMIINPSIAVEYEVMWKNKLMAEEIKSSTYNSKIKGIRQFYDWLKVYLTLNTSGTQLLKENPFAKVKLKPENDSDGAEPLSLSDIRLMEQNPFGIDEHMQERNLLLLYIGIETGIRRTALVGMTKDDILCVDGNYVVNVVDKEDKTANMPINNYYDRLMSWYNKDLLIRRNDSGTIFNIHPSTANEIIKDWAKSVGIDKKITFHSLRTTTGVQVFHRYGQNASRVKKVLNHSKIDTSFKYIEKENKINHDAEGIIQDIEVLDTFETKVQSMTREDLVKMFMNLDDNLKLEVMRNM